MTTLRTLFAVLVLSTVSVGCGASVRHEPTTVRPDALATMRDVCEGATLRERLGVRRGVRTAEGTFYCGTAF